MKWNQVLSRLVGSGSEWDTIRWLPGTSYWRTWKHRNAFSVCKRRIRRANHAKGKLPIITYYSGFAYNACSLFGRVWWTWSNRILRKESKIFSKNWLLIDKCKLELRVTTASETRTQEYSRGTVRLVLVTVTMFPKRAYFEMNVFELPP